MANQVLINHIDNDFNNVNNYSGGALPTDGDTLYIPSGAWVITANVDSATHGLNYINIITEPDFVGQIGTAANPLQMANAGGSSTLSFNSPQCSRGFHLNANTTSVQILGAHHTPSCVSLEGGTHTETRIYSGQGIQLAAGGTFTTVIIDGMHADVEIENGNTVTTLRANAGIARCATTATTTYVYDGVVYLTGSSKTYATVEVHGSNGRLHFECPASTITNCRISRGWGIAILGKDMRNITFTNTIEIEDGAHFRAGGHCIWSGTPDANAWGNPDIIGIPDVTRKTVGAIGGAGS